MISRRALLYGAAAFSVVSCDRSCDKGTPTGDSVGGPPGDVVRPASPIGYSNVATLNHAEARLIVDAGLTLMQAELIPFNLEAAGDLGDMRAQWDRVNGAVQVARAGGATFILTLVNWNGAHQRAQSDAWFQQQLDMAKAIGPAGVWLEPVSEPGSDAKALRWLQMGKAQWAGATIQERQPYGATYSSRHYCAYADLLSGVTARPDWIHSTDCRPTLASTLSDAEITEVTRAANAAHAKLILYDTDNAPSANLHVIATMRAALAG